MRALGVMDGVRRPQQGSSPLVLRSTWTAPVAVTSMPMPDVWSQPGIAVDGLKRIARAIAAPSVTENVSPDVLTPNRTGFSPFAIASLAAVPMLAVGSILGVRNVLAKRQSVSTSPKTTIASASPAPSAAQVAATAGPTEAQSLQTMLDGFNNASTYSLYVQDLKTGQLATVSPDRVFESASLYKLFVANSIYRKIDSGQLSYSSPASGGTGNTVAGCLNLMITISDNGCGQALGSLLGWSNLTQEAKAQGFTGTNLTGTITYTTPRDVALVYQRLYAGTLLNSDSGNQFMNLLRAQKVNNRLPQGLPAGTTFAHKTGDLDGYLHDAGIVFGAKTDYLVVMMGAPGAVPGDFANVNQQLYSFFNK